VVAALNAVEPYDWATLLRTRLDENASGAPLQGFARGGYRLVYSEAPSAVFRDSETSRGVNDLAYSLGMVVNRAGKVTSVIWEGPAFDAGLTVGTTLTAVNGLEHTADRLKAAITAAKGGGAPIELLVRHGDHVRTVRIPYHLGLRYPNLERISGTPARLDDILAPKS
jgi:predicted metalloprotease with PDZ domain